MEPIDVKNGEYDAVFDETGRRYAVEVELRGEPFRHRPTKSTSESFSDGFAATSLVHHRYTLQRTGRTR